MPAGRRTSEGCMLWTVQGHHSIFGTPRKPPHRFTSGLMFIPFHFRNYDRDPESPSYASSNPAIGLDLSKPGGRQGGA